ncbi:MAG: FAD:protein FMN transferase [Oscillospiraceae bacterium]|nr:FAD:protein FMN transferase [Oscillospiraceae bacterium]
MVRITVAGVVAVITLFLCSCATPPNGALSRAAAQTAYFREIYCLNTLIEITVYVDDSGQGGGQGGESALDAAEAVFMRVNGLMDRFDSGSDIYRVNNAPPGGEPVAVNEETYYLLQLAIEYCSQSGGAFDIGMGAVSDLWGLGSLYGIDAVQDYAPPASEQIMQAIAAGGYDKIALIDQSDGSLAVEIPSGMAIDLGGIAKGYAVQAAAEALMSEGVTSAVIDAGGNVHVIGSRDYESRAAGAGGARPWNVGIRSPRPTAAGDRQTGTQEQPPGAIELLAVVSVTDKSVVTSGDYHRYIERDGVRYHHILDPSTGMPATASISVTIVADESTLADYLSTAVFVLGPQKGLELVAQYPGAEALIVAPDMSVTTSPGFEGEIILTGGIQE